MTKNRPMRTLVVASGCLIASLIVSTPGHARTTDFGVRGGLYPDQEEPFLGAEALFGVGESRRWFGNPNVEHVLADRGDLTAFSFDFHYDLPTGSPYTLWVGTGPTLIRKGGRAPGDRDGTDAGVNLLVGFGAKRNAVRPYGQLKLVVADDPEAVLGFGVRF